MRAGQGEVKKQDVSWYLIMLPSKARVIQHGAVIVSGELWQAAGVVASKLGCGQLTC